MSSEAWSSPSLTPRSLSSLSFNARNSDDGEIDEFRALNDNDDGVDKISFSGIYQYCSVHEMMTIDNADDYFYCQHFID